MAQFEHYFGDWKKLDGEFLRYMAKVRQLAGERRATGYAVRQ